MRAKMVNWIIQVLKVFQKSTDETFFLTISIMDRFIHKLAQERWSSAQNEFPKFNYHLVGLVCIWLSSKLEDIVPIFIS